MANIHRSFMQRALALSLKGKGKTHPNPCVGCVVVKGGRIVGEGFHPYYGGDHAEVIALRQAGPRANGGTLYLTLEPCTHWGNTPPCSPTVIASGIKKAFVAMKDPNPLVSGRGLTALRRHGIATQVGLGQQEATAINKAFVTWKTENRPYTILKMAMTLDGKIASSKGHSRWISDGPARTLVHRLRAESDAVLVGAGTALQDNPELTSHGKGRNPLRVVLDPQGRVPSHLKIFKRSAPTVLVTASSKNNKQKFLEKKGIQILRLPLKFGRFELIDVVRYLSKINVSQLLIEGGGETAWNFVKAKLVDELMIFIAPKLLGGRAAKTWLEGEGLPSISQSMQVKEWSVHTIGRDLMVRGLL